MIAVNRKDVKNILKQNWEGEVEVWSITVFQYKKKIPIIVVKILKILIEKNAWQNLKSLCKDRCTAWGRQYA